MIRVSSSCSPLRSSSRSSSAVCAREHPRRRRGAGGRARRLAGPHEPQLPSGEFEEDVLEACGARRAGPRASRRARRTRPSRSASSCGSMVALDEVVARGRAPGRRRSRRQAPAAARRGPARPARKRSCALGAGRVSSPGLPRRSTRAVRRRSRPGRRARSASSMWWVVSTTATPSARSSPISSQVACRACGSRPGGRLVEEDQLGPADDGQRPATAAAAARRTAAGTACGRPRPARAGSSSASGSQGVGVEGRDSAEHLAGAGAGVARRRTAA